MSLATPLKCVADFCLVPIGTSSASVSAEIAEVQRLIRKSGIDYTMHSAGTTLDGPWDQVMKLIGQAHMMLHEKGIVRIQTDIRVGTRTDKSQTPADKVRVVEELLAADTEEPGMQHTADTTRAAPNATTEPAETSSVVHD